MRLAVVTEALTATCTTTSASLTVTTADTSLILGALRVTGTGIPPNTLVTGITSATAFTISQAATATGAVTLTFGVEPVSLAEAKLHLKQDAITTDDALIASLITAARRVCEVNTKRTFLTTTWDLFTDEFPCRGWLTPDNRTEFIQLYHPPLQSVTEIVYVATDGTSTTLATNQYIVSTGTPGFISPAYAVVWPTVRDITEAVRIRYKAGYGNTSASVSDNVKAAMKLLIGHWYEQREAVLTTGVQPATVPMAVDALLSHEMWGGYR